MEVSREIYDGFNELFNLTLLSQAYESAGKYGQARSVLIEALSKAKDRENKFFIGRLLNTLRWFHNEFGNVSRPLELDQESMELGRTYRISNVEISALINLGLNYSAQNQHERELLYVESTLERIKHEAFGAHRWRWMVRTLIGLAELHYRAGMYEEALRFVEEGIPEAQATTSQKYMTKGWGLRGKILEQLENTEVTGIELERAFTLAGQLSSPMLSYPLAYDLGKWCEKVRKEREALDLYSKAKALVENIATTVKDQNLQSKFLQLKQVQEIKIRT